MRINTLQLKVLRKLAICCLTLALIMGSVSCANEAPDGSSIEIIASSTTYDTGLCTTGLGAFMVRYTVIVRDEDGNPMNDIDLQITGSFTPTNFSGTPLMRYVDPATDNNTVSQATGPDCNTMPVLTPPFTYLATPFTTTTDENGVARLVVQYARGANFTATVVTRSGTVIATIEFAETAS